MPISVLIPTYNRPENLRRALDALLNQTRPADEIVLAIRRSDAGTRSLITEGNYRGCLPIVIADAPESGGVIAAMNAGLAIVSNDIVAMTDDDTAPRPEWLARLAAQFERDAGVGGVGGIDIQPGKERATEKVVGVLQWFGREIGNHHIGTGGAREVDFLKGANCAYRTAPLKALGFDTRLRGAGAQVHFELVLGLAFRRAGWRLIYDPAIALDHYPAERHDDDQRNTFHRQALFDQVHNATLAIYEHLTPPCRSAFLLWALAIGSSAEPGIAQGVRFLLRDRHALAKLSPSISARLAGLRTARETRRPETVGVARNTA